VKLRKAVEMMSFFIAIQQQMKVQEGQVNLTNNELLTVCLVAVARCLLTIQIIIKDLIKFMEPQKMYKNKIRKMKTRTTTTYTTTNTFPKMKI